MPNFSRRRFIGASSVITAGWAADLSFLAPWSRAAAADTQITPEDVVFGPETDRLLHLLRSTSAAESVPAFAREIKAGMSYQQFLTVLFLATIENGDPHQVAQVYGAHRISTEAHIEERLLPLFWILHRLKHEVEAGAAAKSVLKPFKGSLPGPSQAAKIFREAMLQSDAAEAERAALALARDRGSRYVMHQLWEFAGRNVGGTLGHTAIAHANSHRALDVIGWQHADVALRYATRVLGGFKGDKTYAANLERAQRFVAQFPPDWAGTARSREATVELYGQLRSGNADAAGTWICSQLSSRRVQAGAVWDAITLAAADTVFRYRTGGQAIGSAQIHAITATNALRYGFQCVDEPSVKLILLLQAAGVTADFFVREVAREGNLREMSLIDLKNPQSRTAATMNDVFAMLPFKDKGYRQKNADERTASDQACRAVFGLLSEASAQEQFMRTARGFLCVKATLDPHDMKFPAAVFEDAQAVGAEWRPYVLASSVHALHGSASRDTPVLRQVKEALG